MESKKIKEKFRAKWATWALLESGAQLASKFFQKIIGVASASLSHVLFATTMCGFVQMMVGLFIIKVRRRKLLTKRIYIIGACLFGFFGAIGSFLIYYIFFLGGEVGASTFITTLFIIPGALADRFIFGHKLKLHQWLGIIIGLFAGYLILDSPSLSEVLNLPLWIWLSFLITITRVINQIITKSIKDIDPFVKNFWGGGVQFLLPIIPLYFLNSLDIFLDFSPAMRKLWLIVIIDGFITVWMWVFNLASYKKGAYIALKNLVVNGTFLIGVMVMGVVIFGESATTNKIVGVALYLAAFSLIDKKIWEFIFLKKKT